MNKRLTSGIFVLAISLALLGAVVTAHKIPADGESAELASNVVSLQAPVGRAIAQVPLRSGFLDPNSASSADDEAFPVAVRISRIGLEAPVISVGVDDRNDFDVPAADTVGWYRYSSAPGSLGSTVLAAHVDYAGREGAFFNLEDLQPGDTLEVELADGSIIEYEVTESILYDKEALPAEELFRKDGASTLQLITCGGAFDSTERSYLGNLVVTAEPIATA
ncbi:MAG: class F sortase [Actinomycetota bacterium]